MTPIPTRYRGTLFRSRLEARHAVFFDAHGIAWSYEPEGYSLDGVRYLPDLWLPDLRTIVEVKGVMDPASEEKINRLAIALSVGGDPFEDYRAPLVVVGVEPIPTFKAYMAGSQSHAFTDHAETWRCTDCGEWFIVASGGSWACRRCGAHDGDRHVRTIHSDRDCVAARCGTPADYTVLRDGERR